VSRRRQDPRIMSRSGGVTPNPTLPRLAPIFDIDAQMAPARNGRGQVPPITIPDCLIRLIQSRSRPWLRRCQVRHWWGGGIGLAIFRHKSNPKCWSHRGR